VPVPAYIRDPANGFTVLEQATLDQWYRDFDIDDAWRLIRRNFDRDCDRQDIDHAVLREYLKDIAQAYRPLLPSAPLAAMDSVFGARRSHFLLPGLPIAGDEIRVARVVRADHLLKYQLHPAGIGITMGLGAFIAALRAGTLGGRDLAGSHMGRQDCPVWVCPAGLLPASAEDCRDRLGLQHLHHGHLVSITYPAGLLGCGWLALRAPTVLDGAAGGADNWIFAKRQSPGGPDWGHAVDLVASTPGVDEAVHRDFLIDAARAAQMTLGHVGQIRRSSPQVDFATLMAST